MKSLLMRMKLLRAFVALIKDPKKTEKIFEISDVSRGERRATAEETMKAVLENPDFQRLYESRYNPKIEIEKLRELAPGTFGRAVAEFLDQHGFEPNAFPSVGAASKLEYLVTRVRQVHDLWHVLTGYDTSVEGELALQGFSMAQLRTPFSGLLLAGGMLHLIIYRPTDLFRTFEGVVDGFLRGKQSQNLITLRIEDLWGRSLQQVRSELLGESGQLRKISFAIDPLESERGRLVN